MIKAIKSLCSLCGTDTYGMAKRTDTQGEKVHDVCRYCNDDAQKTAGRQSGRSRDNTRLTSAQWIEILQQSHGYCFYCKEYEGCDHLVPDHVIPLSKGGTNNPENIVACCVFCNNGKQHKSAEWWLEQIRNGYYQRPGTTFIRNGRRVEA